ncbi:MAG: AAA family ATPase [Desulfobacterales bacterium]|nr:AAA family ATPase [Desulfobacterales bacterium]
MTQRIGLCGSHRTGKTTLAVALSKSLGIDMIPIHTSAVFAEHKLDPAQPMDIATRMQIQHKILDRAIESWQPENRDMVSDRTPLDMLAYMFADIQGSIKVDNDKMDAYIHRCFEVTNYCFTHLVVIQPGIPLVFEKGKAALNRAYMEHLNSLIIGLCYDERMSVPKKMVIHRKIILLEERFYAILQNFFTNGYISYSLAYET